MSCVLQESKTIPGVLLALTAIFCNVRPRTTVNPLERQYWSVSDISAFYNVLRGPSPVTNIAIARSVTEIFSRLDSAAAEN